MASFLLDATPTFPVGTSVGAYQKLAFPRWRQPEGSPPVVADETQTVSATGRAFFTNLLENVPYAFGASVSGTWRFVTGVPSLEPAASTLAQFHADALTAFSAEATAEALLGLAIGDLANNERDQGGLIPLTATVTSAGDTTLLTPSPGSQIKVMWAYAVNDPDQATTPVVAFKFGSTEFYRVFAVSHWEPFTGAVDEPLVVNLSDAGSVAITVHYREIL